MERSQQMSPTDPFEGASVIASTTDTAASGPIPSSAPSAIATGHPGAAGRVIGGGRGEKRHKASRSVAWSEAWSDRGRKKSVEMGKYTFYREGTPPPADRPPIVVGGGGGPVEPYDYKYDHVAPPAPIPVPTVCGVRRRVFWMVTTAVLVVLVLAIGIGVGVGVGTSRSSSSDDAPDAQNSGTATQSSTEPPSSTIPPITTSTSAPSSTTSTTPATTVTGNPAITTLVSCPAANNTVFRVPGTQTTFLRLCGIDYSGENAEELAHAWTPTMEDCIITCAGYTGCEAASWGILEDDPGSYHRCWMKRNIRRSRPMRAGWDFAILQEQEDEDD